MTGFLGPLIGAGASIGAGIFGSSQADQAKKSGKKAAQQQIKLSKEQLAASEGQYTTDLATQQKVLDAQLAATGQTKAEQNRLYAAGLAREQAMINAERQRAATEFAPYTDYGRESLAARQGLYGESPEAAQGFIDRFHASPTYALNYESMKDEAQKAAARQARAGSGMNQGAVDLALGQRAADVSNRLLGQYVGDINQGVNWGLDAAGRLVDAEGRLVGLGMQSSQYATSGGAQAAQNYANAVRADQGAYGTNTMQLGQNRLANVGAARGGIGQGYANKAANAAAAAAGKTAAWNTAAQGVGQAFGAGSQQGNFYGGPGSSWLAKQPWNVAT
jgi:hypothetical protein